MEFDSHRSSAVAVAVAVINELTPGYRHGREYPGPVGEELVAATERAIYSVSSEWGGAGTVEECEALAKWCVRLHEVVALVADRDVDQAAVTLNAILRDAGAVPTLARHGSDPWHLHFHPADAPWTDGWVAGMATSLAIIIGNPVVDRLGVCTAPACDRIYVDTSRNGTKRFCSTACQNRVKAATFRARHAGLP